MRRDSRNIPKIEQLESRELLSVSSVANADVQRTFAGNIVLSQPLEIQVSAKRHTLIRRAGFTLNVSSESTSGQLLGTMSVKRLGAFAVKGSISGQNFSLSLSDSADDQGTFTGTARDSGTQIAGRFNASASGHTFIGSARGSAPVRASSVAVVANVHNTPILSPALNNGPLTVTPINNGMIEPGNGVITRVTGFAEPSNGFVQPFVGAAPVGGSIATTTGAISPNIGFIGSGALGGDFVTGGISGSTMNGV